MRTSSIGRIMQQVGGMLGGSGRRSSSAGSRARRPRTGSPRTRTTANTGRTGGLGRMVKRFLR